MSRSSRPGLGAVLFFSVAFLLGVYFTFAAVQGDYGLLRRVEIARGDRPRMRRDAGIRSLGARVHAVRER